FLAGSRAVPPQARRRFCLKNVLSDIYLRWKHVPLSARTMSDLRRRLLRESDGARLREFESDQPLARHTPAFQFRRAKNPLPRRFQRQIRKIPAGTRSFEFRL